MFRETEKQYGACLSGLGTKWELTYLRTRPTITLGVLLFLVIIKGVIADVQGMGSSTKTSGWGLGRFLSFKKGLVLSCSGDCISICSCMGHKMSLTFIADTCIYIYIYVHFLFLPLYYIYHVDYKI